MLIRHARDGDEFLRVTWHEHDDVLVFSHWVHDTCTAATPIRVADVGDLATLLVTALASHVPVPGHDDPAWPAPDPATVVDPHLALPA